MSNDLITRLGQIKLPTIAERGTRNEAMERIAALEAENARLREALEEIAEERDVGRHDGLPEGGPAHEDYVMWLRARAALGDDA